MTEPTREARLVLACARVDPGAEGLARIASLAQGGVDWDSAVRLGMRHGLAPLMNRNLAAAHVPLPKAASAALWARAESVANRNRAMARELSGIAQLLESEGVRFAPFKGPVLAASAYRDLALREFGDLDILVASADVRRARSALQGRGYSLHTPLDPVQEETWLSSAHYELPLVDAARGFMVELQWRANPDVPVPPLHDPRWWDSAPMTQIEGVRMRTLPPDEQMLALLVHGAKHLWGSLDWLVDIAELARAGEVPWERVTQLARRHGVVRRMALGLALARDLLEVPLPAAVDRKVRETGVTEIVRQIAAPLFALEYSPPTIAHTLRMEIALCDSTSRRVRRIARLARPTPGDWLWCRLPRQLAFLYWGLRPVRLAAKYLSPRSPRIPTGASPRTPPPQPHSTN